MSESEQDLIGHSATVKKKNDQMTAMGLIAMVT